MPGLQVPDNIHGLPGYFLPPVKKELYPDDCNSRQMGMNLPAPVLHKYH